MEQPEITTEEKDAGSLICYAAIVPSGCIIYAPKGYEYRGVWKNELLPEDSDYHWVSGYASWRPPAGSRIIRFKWLRCPCCRGGLVYKHEWSGWYCRRRCQPTFVGAEDLLNRICGSDPRKYGVTEIIAA